LVATAKKQDKVSAGLYVMLQVLKVSLFEKTPLLQIVSQIKAEEREADFSNQLELAQ
jgi:hypothetical protein